MIALEVINAVQRELRLPESGITDKHSVQMLSLLNRTIAIMEGFMRWDELKATYAFTTVAGTADYAIPYNISSVASVTVNGMVLRDDERKAYRYDILRKVDGTATLTIYPTPDAAYNVVVTLYKMAGKITTGETLCPLPAEVCIAGTVHLAKQQSGRDASAELSEFQSMLSSMLYSRNKSKIMSVGSIL